MRKAKLFFINGLILTITSLLIRGAGFIFNIYIANKVGSEAIGIFTLVMSVYLFAITLATSGISMACTCIVSEEFAKKDYIEGFRAVRTCILFSIILGLSAMSILFLFAPIISETCLKGKISATPLYFIGFGLPLIAISSVINGYFSAIGKSYQNAISQILEFITKILATILLLHFFPSKDIETVCNILILADVISEVFSFTLNIFLYFYNHHKHRFLDSKSFMMKKRILEISFPIAITSYIRSGLSSLKQFLIPIRLELSGLTYSMAVSYYGIIHGMVMPVLMFASSFINSFSNLLVPEFSRLLASQNPKRMQFVCNKIFNATFIFSIGITALFLFFSNDISLLIFQTIEYGKWIKLLSPLIVFMYVDNILDNILKGINQQFGVMCCNILDLVITITFIYFLVPIFGIPGYIFIICFSEILNFTISSIQLKKKISYRIDWIFSFILPILISVISYFISCYICTFLSLSNFTLNVIIKLGIFFILYFVLYIRMDFSYISRKKFKFY